MMEVFDVYHNIVEGSGGREIHDMKKGKISSNMSPMC